MLAMNVGPRGASGRFARARIRASWVAGFSEDASQFARGYRSRLRG